LLPPCCRYSPTNTWKKIRILWSHLPCPKDLHHPMSGASGKQFPLLQIDGAQAPHNQKTIFKNR
jgi:hypothetical protein